MSIFKEINDSEEEIKLIAIPLFLVPFWVVVIFLFNNEFYRASDSIIIITMSIVISMVSAFWFFSIMFLIYRMNKQKSELLQTMGFSVILLIVWTSILTVILYSIGFLYNIYFYFFYVLVIFCIPILIVNLRYIYIKKFKLKKKSLQKK